MEPKSIFGARKYLINGGQGRNRTADASLFRAVVFEYFLFDSI